MVIPRVHIFHRHPSFKEKLLMVIWLMSDDFNIVKIHLMMTLVDMAHNFGIFIEHQNSLFVLRHLHLQWSFCLAIVHKIALSAIDFVHYSKDGWSVLHWWIMLLWSWKNAVDGVLQLVQFLADLEEYLRSTVKAEHSRNGWFREVDNYKMP